MTDFMKHRKKYVQHLRNQTEFYKGISLGILLYFTKGLHSEFYSRFLTVFMIMITILNTKYGMLGTKSNLFSTFILQVMTYPV